jgi:hypothetical protein
MSNEYNEMAKETILDDVLELKTLEIINELAEVNIVIPTPFIKDTIIDMLVEKRFNELPDGPC